LINKEGDLSFTGVDTQAINCSWIIYPRGPYVVLKSAVDLKNLSIWCDKGPKTGAGHGVLSELEDDASQFVISEGSRSDTFFFESVLTQNTLQSDCNKKVMCVNRNKQAWEVMTVVPVHKCSSNMELAEAELV
jgi:hypothetical protein